MHFIIPFCQPDGPGLKGRYGKTGLTLGGKVAFIEHQFKFILEQIGAVPALVWVGYGPLGYPVVGPKR